MKFPAISRDYSGHRSSALDHVPTRPNSAENTIPFHILSRDVTKDGLWTGNRADVSSLNNIRGQASLIPWPSLPWSIAGYQIGLINVTNNRYVLFVHCDAF